MNELKPCPFCGNEKCFICCDTIYEENFGVMCPVCGGSIFPDKETEEEAIEAWNKRTETEVNIYDEVETYQNCTVEVLKNSVTGETSVGWWKNEN